MSMIRIYTLSNGLRIGVLGQNAPLIFDDNTKIDRYNTDYEDLTLQADAPNNISINNIKVSIAYDGKFILTTSLKDDVNKMVVAYTKKEVDILISPPHCIGVIYDYLSSLYPNIPIHSPDIFDFDNDTAVCRINLFIRYNPNKLLYDDTI